MLKEVGSVPDADGDAPHAAIMAVPLFETIGDSSKTRPAS